MSNAARPEERKTWPPYWLQVRAISNSTAARLTILIPIVGYWIIFNDYLLASSRLLFDGALPSNASPVDKAQAVSWRLFATYFGLCFIAAASAIYQALCPREVKQYGSPTEYIAAVSPHMSDIEEERVRSSLEARSRATLERRYAYDIVRGGPLSQPAEQRRLEEVVDRANVLQAHFDQCNRSHPKWRSVLGACYAAGAGVLFWPTADIFVRVTLAMIRAIKAQLLIL